MEHKCICKFTLTCKTPAATKLVHRILLKELAFCRKCKGNAVQFSLSPNHFAIILATTIIGNQVVFTATTEKFLDAASVVKIAYTFRRRISEITATYRQEEQGLFGTYVYNVVADEFTWKSLPFEFWPTEKLNEFKEEPVSSIAKLLNILNTANNEHGEIYTTTGEQILKDYEKKLKAHSIVLADKFKNIEDNDNIEDTESSDSCKCAESDHTHKCECGHCKCDNHCN